MRGEMSREFAAVQQVEVYEKALVMASEGTTRRPPTCLQPPEQLAGATTMNPKAAIASKSLP